MCGSEYDNWQSDNWQSVTVVLEKLLFILSIGYCLLLITILSSCSVSNLLSLLQKYSPEELNKDYAIFRACIGRITSGIYWYTPKMKWIIILSGVKVK